MIELILGGARSGKSALAEQQAIATGLFVVYIATAQARDDEMTQRIAHHSARRPENWLLVEEPITLSAALEKYASSNHCIIVDCLTLWLSNLIFSNDSLLKNETAALLDVLINLPGKIIFVSNEVGMGIVPMGAINRLFVDEQGRLNQKIAQLADRVTFVAAGLPLELKSTHKSF